ncbi:unknown [Firmicutes bacterium CAG:170]|nr:unknown [Firmicutes bacterium CAG:170]
MLFLVIGLGAVQRDIGHHAEAAGGLVVALGKDGVVKVGAPADERLEGLMIDHDDRIRRAVQANDSLRPFFSDQGGVAAGNDVAVGVDHADHAVGGLLHLNDHTLKNTAGHARSLLKILLFTQTTIDIILRIQHYCKRFLTFYFKKRCLFCELFIVLRHKFQDSRQDFSIFRFQFVRENDENPQKTPSSAESGSSRTSPGRSPSRSRVPSASRRR